MQPLGIAACHHNLADCITLASAIVEAVDEKACSQISAAESAA